MKAAVYFGPEDIRCTEVQEPRLTEDHEVLVRVHASSICGSDLHIFRGALDDFMRRGHSRTGHELVGEIVDRGGGVFDLSVGDRITMAYSCSCGSCHMCRLGQTAHCETTRKAVYGFGDPFGDLNGTHAEYIVLPHASAHTLRIPQALDDASAVTLSCNLPTAIIANALVDIQRGEHVAIVGCGPTGLMALQLAVLRNPGCLVAIDHEPHRLQIAAASGAVSCIPDAEDFPAATLKHSGGRGFDKVIEMVGTADSLQTALDLVRPGGTIAALGVFTENWFNLNLADVFLRDISLHMHGFANVQPFMREGLRLIDSGRIKPAELFTHEFALSDIDVAFRTFSEKDDEVVKVLIRS